MLVLAKVPQEFLKFYKMNNTKEITRGGEFIVKETKCENIFTTEDFSEEQKMMRDAVKEFADKEIWSKKDEFEVAETLLRFSRMNQKRLKMRNG